jgi:TPR repeat protein
VSEYEKELQRLRSELHAASEKSKDTQATIKASDNMSIGESKSNYLNTSTANSRGGENEAEFYRRIPGFKENMRILADQLWPEVKENAILYYEAAALHGCVESCFKVAMHNLEAESGNRNYEKAKVFLKCFFAFIVFGQE